MNNKRKDNQELFIHYVINEEERKHILLSLTPLEFAKYCKMNIKDLNMNCYMCLEKMLNYYKGLEKTKRMFHYILN